MRLPHPPLLVITDQRQASMSLETVAARLFAGGCRWLSLREKDMTLSARLDLLRRLLVLGARWGALITVHEDAAAAIEAGAAGVHLSAGASTKAARRLLGGRSLIGQSAHNAEEVAKAAAEGADYVTLSPIFTSASKPGYGPALGPQVLGQAWPLPVVALGGVDETNIAACFAAGASGVAVMGCAMRAADPDALMADLLARKGTKLAVESSRSHS